MDSRFFVTIIASSRRNLRELAHFDLDVFYAAERRTSAELQTFGLAARQQEVIQTIDGLLTLEQIGHLARSGYQILIREDAAKLARAQTEITSFEEWLKGMQEEEK